MIRINVKKDNNQIKRIIIKGHANYDEYGKDIVCAATSATYLTTINACLSIDDKSINVKDNEVKVINNNEYINILLNNMINCLEDLEKQYPKNIKINKEEI